MMQLVNRCRRHKAITSSLFSLLIATSLFLFVSGCNFLGSSSEPDTTPPSAPSGLEATSGDGALDLSWSAPGEEDVDGYNLYRSTSSIGDVSNASAVNDSPISDTSYEDTGVENGTTYYYVVTAVDDDENESGPSGEVDKTPFANPPDRPDV